MNILFEGSRWVGQWTEIVADSFNGLGHWTLFHYHNEKTRIMNQSETYSDYGIMHVLFRHGKPGRAQIIDPGIDWNRA